MAPKQDGALLTTVFVEFGVNIGTVKRARDDGESLFLQRNISFVFIDVIQARAKQSHQQSKQNLGIGTCYGQKGIFEAFASILLTNLHTCWTLLEQC